MNITLQGTNLELTDKLRLFVDEKMQDALRPLGDLSGAPVDVAIELEKTTRHHRKHERLYRAEVNVSVPGRMLRVEESADDLYQAIIKMKHTLNRAIRSWRARQGANRPRVRTTPSVSASRADEAPIWEAGEEELEDIHDLI